MTVAPVVCLTCRCGPCACSWIHKLETLDHLTHARDVAALMFPVPLPVVDGRRTYHFDACPCPRCYALRSESWTLPEPFPAPPERESWPQLRRLDATA